MRAEWLSVAADGTFSEIYAMDRDSLRFLDVNRAACTNLQYDKAELLGMTLANIVQDLAANKLAQALQSLRHGRATQATLESAFVRKDGTFYPIELRLFHCTSKAAPAFVVIGTDISAHKKHAEALLMSESRFHAIVSNTPGLVYQFLRRPDGHISFLYLSEGCQALLGIGADQLQSDSSLFLDLILPEDRPSYIESMSVSAAGMTTWNWEGRFWIEEWKDTKWINLRATPRALADASVQWEGIMTNITQSKLEEAEIKRSHEQLAELSAHVQTVKEQERTRIAREIHDDLGGNLTAIKMALALLTRRLPPDETGLAEKAEYVDSLVDRTIETVHRIAGDLRPSMLDFGLVAAIDWQAREFEKQLGIPCDFSSNKKEIALHLDQATALFRIFQEALTNISKHARASRVLVKLIHSNRGVRLDITDNGKGIAAADRMKPKSFGIRGMMERAIALGGDLSISAAKGGGSVVSIKIPLPPS